MQMQAYDKQVSGKIAPLHVLSCLIAVLASIATLEGLLWPGLYRDSAYLLPQTYGQDIVTLLIGVPLLVFSTYFSIRGSLRWRLIWLGALFYFLYAYITYSFGAAYNELFLVYVSVFSLSSFAFIGGLITLNVDTISHMFSQKTPVRATAIFLILSGVLVALMWLVQLLPALFAGKPPELLVLSRTTTLVIQALDLGIIGPLFIVTGIWLWKNKPWGYSLAGILLIKGATLGAAVLSMIYFMQLEGIAVSWAQVVFFIVITVTAIILSIVFLTNLKEEAKSKMLNVNEE